MLVLILVCLRNICLSNADSCVEPSNVANADPEITTSAPVSELEEEPQFTPEEAFNHERVVTAQEKMWFYSLIVKVRVLYPIVRLLY